ncbi:MAG: PolC-type DNA polymerase III [bacterium]|nr:PolC-type DNA polymerase III [bacterium]
MEKRVNDLLKRINYPIADFSNFENSKILKIVVKEDKDTWDIYIENDKTFLYEKLELFKKCLCDYVNKKYTYNLIISVLNEDYSLFSDYYKKILILINNNNLYYNMFFDRLIRDGDDFFIEVYNKSEEITLGKKIDLINKYFASFGYKRKVSIRMNTLKGEEIKEEILKERENISIPITNIPSSTNNISNKETKSYKKTYNNKKELFGTVSGNVTSLNDISYEMDNIVVEVKIFEVVPPSKKGFFGITLKVTDFTTSMYVNIYNRSQEELDENLSKLKSGMWIRVSGYVKNNNYYNDFVINARRLEPFEKEEKIIMDDEEEKRIELHAHTMMSQMDGVVSVTDLINRAIKWGHKAIAITDHNGIQTFPTAMKFKDKIKILYGVELSMIDDDIDLVIRPDDSILLDNTYVVFDFETTGFNAGGGDSIIEVGAVKICNGEIISSFDRLINPGKKLEDHIVKLTHITDEMLFDCPDEETIIKEFIEWTGDLPMVAHNAKFDASFLVMAYQKYNLGEFTNPLIDTLQLSRAIDTDYSRHSLSALVKRYDIEFDEEGHHRADYDALATAKIFHQMLVKLKSRKIEKMSDIDLLVSRDEIHKFGEMFHINILVKNGVGLKNLFKILSYASTKYLYKTPRILRSEIEKHREGLLLSSGCANSEIFRLARSKSEEEVGNLMNFYDFIEVQPPEVYSYLIDLSDFNSKDEVIDNINKIIKVAKDRNKLVVATGDVHHLDRSDKIYREIIVNQKVPGGGRHPLNRKDIKSIPSMHFRTTSEMLSDFSFLGDYAKEIVITNTNKVADMISDFEIIPDTHGIPFSPKFENSDKIITDICYEKATSIYGDPLPSNVKERLDSELSGIINGGFDSIYLISQKLVEKSNKDGYVVGSRGSVGSSFVATMLGISEVNPLPAHYVCPNCKKSIFNYDDGTPFGKDYPSGYDLPDRTCECGSIMKKEGQDMPFATFLGFNADKVPDIDLNFSGEYQARAHEFTKVMFGEDHVYRAGTIGTVAEKTAFGFVKGYYEDRGIEGIRSLEVERLAKGVTGVKRTTGQHPGGIVVVPDYKEIFDFTPFSYPADDINSEWAITHFNYHDIEDCLLKLDILGHDNPTIFKMLEDLTGIDPSSIPMDDKGVMSLFTSTDALGVTPSQIGCEVGCLGLPEFTKFVIGIVLETKPTTFAELVKISGLSHGTDVWNGNAQELVKNNICPFKETIGCRDDIMVYLSNHGIKPLDAFKIMELVRKGRQVKMKDKWDEYKKLLKENNIPDWYIDSCDKIKYMFPKAHATAYVSAAFRIAWYKINRPIEYYATYFSIKSFSFDLEVMEEGYDKISEKLAELRLKKFGLTVKEQDLISTLEIALEMTARGFKFSSVDLEKSHSKNFLIAEDGITLIPPFRAIDGLGDTVANNIITERENKYFLSIDDFSKRCKVSGTLTEKMRIMGILKGLPESSQISLFDLM